ncbi:MAG: hypothetical protein NTV30_11035, partial [Chloroflexi bacterium]|nr:hypothetical protein [Chloroflexota bacterium]
MLDQYYDRVKWLDSLIVDRAGKFYQQERDRQSYIKEYSDQLQRTTRFLDLVGNPQNKFSSIHVAGTSGKGSVVSMLGAILKQSGLTMGVHTSPYLQVCTEKLVINGKMISPGDFVE